MIPDVQKAKKQLSVVNGIEASFFEYSSAYTATNENLRYALKFMPEKAENILTVAASGDHPMFAVLNGAKNIDTFDITYNAKCIMDIKTVALQVLDREQYCKLLSDLWDTTDITSVPNMSKIIGNLPDTEREYLISMHGYMLFNHGCGTYKKSLPTDSEYAQMRQKIKQPFNFIWTPITSLHHHLDKSYDFIHLSNIFDCISQDDQINVLFNLIRYVKPKGVICFECIKNKPVTIFNYCDLLAKANKEKLDIKNSILCPVLHILQREK